MYNNLSIAPLSQRQVSRLLNHYPVRVSPGSEHNVELSLEQSKKHKKAHMKGTGYTLQFDPFQVSRHQYLRGKGTGTELGSVLGHVAGQASQAAGTR